jgi:hypothetical protein
MQILITTNQGNMFSDENLNCHVQLQNQICEFKGMLTKLMQKLAKVQI